MKFAEASALDAPSDLAFGSSSPVRLAIGLAVLSGCISVLSAQSTNLALGKPATQSSTFDSNTVAGNAVDGNTDGNYMNGSTTHTNFELKPWWQVDLGATATINTIEVWNRTDCCADRLSNYWVFVSNTPFLSTDTPESLRGRAGTWSSAVFTVIDDQTILPNPSTSIPASGAQGRYVRVQLSGTNYLQLAEVRVMGTMSGGGAPVAPPSTYSILGKVTGSTATLTLSGTSSGSTTTDGSGNFSFAGLANGSYVVAPSQSGFIFAPSAASVSINGASATAVNFTATAVVTPLPVPPPPVQHSVTLTWLPSTSPSISGYNLYRGTVSGGPYAKLNSSPLLSTSYLDSSVAAGQTYFYVATTVSGSAESTYSAQAVATVPTP